MPRLRPWVLIPLLAACAGDPVSPEAIAERRTAWLDQGITAYDFTLTRSCFCPLTGTFAVRVVGGTVVRVVGSDGNVVELTDQTRPSFPDILGLFDLLLAAQAGGADSIAVTWHGSLHYPTDIYIDYIRNAIDDELALRAADLVPGIGTAAGRP